jgi:hypothetical protein
MNWNIYKKESQMIVAKSLICQLNTYKTLILLKVPNWKHQTMLWVITDSSLNIDW